MKVKKWKLASFLLPCLLLFALIYLAPMCMVFGSSFFEWKAGGVFKFIGLDNYINAFRNDARMLTALKNTGIWVVLQSVVHVMLGTVIAFMLSKRKKGWKVLRTIYMIPNVVSAAALAVIFLNVFNAQYGIINSFVKTVTGKPFMKNWFFDQNSAFITVTWSWLLYTGMIIILVLAGVLSIPEDVVEAAKNLNRNVMTMWKEEKLRLEDKSSMKRRFFIRMKGNVEEKIEDIRYSFGDVEIVKVDGLDGEFGFVTPIMMEGDYDTRAKSYEDQILHMIRIED